MGTVSITTTRVRSVPRDPARQLTSVLKPASITKTGVSLPRSWQASTNTIKSNYTLLLVQVTSPVSIEGISDR